MTFKDYLISKDACDEAVEWVGDKSLKKSWATCKRSDWMLWLLEHSSFYDERKSRLMTCDFVREIWHLLDDERSKQAVIVAEKYANGQATLTELDVARYAASDAAMDAFSDAAMAAARTASSDVASDVARYTASDTDMEKQAGIIRKYIPDISIYMDIS